MFYRERLPKADASAWQARRVIDRLRGELGDTALANARLLVTELVANAVEQVPGEGEIGLEVTLAVGVLRVEVHHDGGEFPAGDTGWWLRFAELLADRWGSGGQRVWFEISA